MAYAFFTQMWSQEQHMMVDRIMVVAAYDEIKNLDVLKKIIDIKDEGDRIVFEFPLGRLNDIEDKMSQMKDEMRRTIQKAKEEFDKTGIMPDLKFDIVKAEDFLLPTTDFSFKKMITSFLMGMVHEGRKYDKDERYEMRVHRTSSDKFYEMVEAHHTSWFDKGKMFRKAIEEKIKRGQISTGVNLIEYMATKMIGG